MTTGFPRLAWIRLLAAGAATVVLHLVLAGWLQARLAAPGKAAVASGAAAGAIVAHLRVRAPVVQHEARAARPSKHATTAARPVKSLAAPVRPAAQGYQVALPPSVRLIYDVTRADVPAEQELIEWTRSGGRYHLRVQHNGGELESEGVAGDAGIEPRTARERRRGRAQTATHFDAGHGRITFSASQAQVALQSGAQDKASFVMQLAGIARADPQQLRAELGMMVAAERDAQVFGFTLAGEEDIETGLGPMAAWHLVRPAPPGSYHAQLDIWLAPQHHWYPVQLRSTEANGIITTRTIREIVIKEN